MALVLAAWPRRRLEPRNFPFDGPSNSIHGHGKPGGSGQDLDADNDDSDSHGGSSSSANDSDHGDGNTNGSNGNGANGSSSSGNGDNGKGSGGSSNGNNSDGSKNSSSDNSKVNILLSLTPSEPDILDQNGQSHPTDGSGTFQGICGAAPSSVPPDPTICTVVNENDGRLKYGPGWVLTSDDPFGQHLTIHSTTTSGSFVVVDFNGTSIVVFGTVPQSNATTAPPSATYSIDGGRAVQRSLPIADVCIPNQQFFQSFELSPGAHNLTINVTTPDETPYILDYLWFCTTKTPQTSSSVSVETKAASHDKLSRLDAIVLGSVLGGVFLLLCIATLVWLVIRRRRRRIRSLRKLHISGSPVSSWLHWNSRICTGGGSGNGTEVAFTSTESILRDNPSYSSRSLADSKEIKPAELFTRPISTAPLPSDEPQLPPGLSPAPSQPISYATTQTGGRTSLIPPPWSYQTR
ncbi:hypothetical protein BD414DRAFT_531521 [Trametes punicea]|nr:hypothetical protein BD414DRAFT_531521 [Trametes punicea]